MAPLPAQRARPDRAFERMYRRYLGDVYHYALAVMRNQADAEDVTQTTFLNAYRAFVERGERPQKPHNWLIAIAHNVCRQRFRQSARRPTEVAFDDDIGTQLVEPDDDAPSGEDIRRALGHLAFNQRAALVMRELEGRSYAEISEILDLSPSAVETLIFRARRALREQLESSLTCGDAELAISRQLDGRLPRGERGALRAHLRECKECATFARRQRAQRTALKSLAAVPIPTSLTSLFGGGAAVGTGVAVKAAGAVALGALLGGVGYTGVRHVVHHPAPQAPQVEAPQATRATHATHARPAVAMANLTHVVRALPRKAQNGRAAHQAGVAAAARARGRARGHTRARVDVGGPNRSVPPHVYKPHHADVGGPNRATPHVPSHPVHPTHPSHPAPPPPPAPGPPAGHGKGK